MEIKIIETDDGSHTLFVPELNEHYHSTHGAINESMHIFIDAGLHEILKSKNEVSILEIGFGTGLNAFLTCIEASKIKKQINYQSIEMFPLPIDKNLTLNYSSKINGNQYLRFFQKIISTEWEHPEIISDFFILTKIKTDATLFIPEFESIDLVYFDAFSPDVQPEMWTEKLFEQIYFSMKKNSIFVTYSSKGVVKRALKSVGFIVEKIPGPKGKREILRAYKN